MATVSLKSICKSYGPIDVLKDVNFDIKDGEFVVLVGPSGCGKSTLLRMIAGLESITSGELSMDGRCINEVAPEHRELAMVFQSYALYPNMTVEQNMGFALKMAKFSGSEQTARVKEAARVLQLEPYLDRKPAHLSGGQRQRVAIGRAIVRQPKLFLFDEPLSNLDAALRVQMRVELAALHQRLAATMIYVTHDQVEAMTLADRIVVMRNGVVEQIGTPSEIYENPKTIFVAGFIGMPKINLLPAIATWQAADLTIELACGARIRPPASWNVHAKQSLTVGIRPDDLCIVDKGEFTAVVDLVENLGNERLIYLSLSDGNRIVVRSAEKARLAKGEKIEITLRTTGIHGFGEDGRSLVSAAWR